MKQCMNQKFPTIVSSVRMLMLSLLLIGVPLAFAPVYAQNHGGDGRGGGGGGRGNDGRGNGPGRPGGHDGGSHMDPRHSHNQPYYNHGHQIHGAPHGGYEIHHGGQSYWYDRNHWYRRRGGVSIVIGAPIGAFVPLLPSFYSTIWWGGVPYYYANDTYYTWNGPQDEYEVVDPPDGIDNASPNDMPQSEEIFVYPKNGQSTDQQERDRYECHRSAVDQTGFDPTVGGGGVSADSASAKRSDYLRAQASCLDARGYSVR